ncbi:MAG: phosphoribosyl-AMP cyclohydrolase [Leptonema sp. (in: bacteria)]
MQGNNSKSLEETQEILLDYKKIQTFSEFPNLLPVIVQNYLTKEVLFLAYVTPEVLQKTIELKEAVFFSTSRKEIWHKGKTSKNYLEIVEIRVNCEQNCLLFLVVPKNHGVCHTKDANNNYRSTCFYRKLKDDHLEFIKEFL